MTESFEVAENAPVVDMIKASAKVLGVQSGPVRIEGADPVTCSHHRIRDASASSIALFGQQVVAIAPRPKACAIEEPIDALRATFLFTVNGQLREYLDINPAEPGCP